MPKLPATTHAEKATLRFEVGDPETETFGPVNLQSAEERWVGEHNAFRVFPNIADMTFQWLVPGYHIWYHELGENEETGKILPMQPEDYQKNGLSFYWMEGSGGQVYDVIVNVALNGKTGSRVAKYVVKTPLVSVLVDHWQTELVTIPPESPLSYKYIFGAGADTPEDDSDDIPGIESFANVIDAPLGYIAWAQLMNWETHVNFAGDPFPLANPNTGPGPYTQSANGLDTEYALVPEVSHRFKDFPVMSFLVSTTGDGGTIDHRAEFKTYLMWISARPRSLPATLRRIDWTWAFTANTFLIGNGIWMWGPSNDTSSSSGAIITSEIPEWDSKVIIAEHKFKPDA